MGFSLKLDERMPVNFGSGFRLSDGERALRFGSVMKPDESKIWDCSPRAPEQREPVKFEAGMVVKWRDTPVARYAIRSVEPDYVRCWRLDRDDPFCGFQISAYGASFELVSPAPRAGDTWTSSESVARIEADGAQLRIVSEGEPFAGDVVAVARRLWEGGYRRVDSEAMVSGTRRETVFASGRSNDGATARVFRETMEDVDAQIARTICGPVEAEKLRAEERRRSPPMYVTLDDLKACVPTHEEQVRGVHSREYDGEFRPALPRPGDVCQGAWETYEIVQRSDGTLHSRTLMSARPTLERAELVGVPPDRMAQFLRERGCTRVEPGAAKRILEMVERTRRKLRDEPLPHWKHDSLSGAGARLTQPRIDATTPQSPLDGLSHESLADRTDRVRDVIDQCSKRGDSVGEAARKIKDALVVGATADRVSELRAGMVVRENAAQPVWGVVRSVRQRTFTLRWSCGTTVHHDNVTFGKRVASGIWTVVEPDVRPLASLAYAVAAIFALPDRATSRRYVDDALAQLRGEPFVDAIRAALVGTSERTNLTPSEISACIAALRHWEARRPFDRDLGALQRRTNDFVRGGLWNRLQGEATDVLLRALGYRPVWDYDNLWFLYERARSSR